MTVGGPPQMESREAPESDPQGVGARFPLDAGKARFAALAKRAERAMLAERVWPPLVWAASVAALFLASSWAGLWLIAAREARMAGVALFAVAALAALAPLARLRRPAPREALARLDRDAGAAHRPASSFADALANAGDPQTQALWALHQRQLAKKVAGIAVAPPAPRMAARDAFALRFAAAMLAVAAGLVAGPERYGRLAAAFDWRGEAAIAAANRVDVWIDPPAYAGRPPIVVDLAHADKPQDVTTPEDSILIVRGDHENVATSVEGALNPAPAKEGEAAASQNEKRWTIRGDGKATIARGDHEKAVVTIKATPAGAPSITLTGEPIPNISGSLTLAYRLADRYGVAGAKADFAREGESPARTLVPPPETVLTLPAAPNGVGEARTTTDLSEHPWAGARVLMTLSAVSVSGRSSQSGPIPVTLPERSFHDPLARALVEQRRSLVLDPDHAPPRLITALTGLAVAPELFGVSAGVHLGLKQAKAMLEAAHDDPALIEVAAFLWAMALQIEDGDASQAQRDLRAAEQALREALQRGASDEEIRKLSKELREAARRFMQELARNQPSQDAQMPAMREQDLESLLDRMEDTARNGAREDAEAMLDQMQEMFENMRGAREAEMSPAEREMRKQIEELDKLLRDQQALRDETFRRDQRERARRANPEGEDQADKSPDQPGDEDGQGPSLEERQKALRDRLAELQRKLKEFGMKGEKGFEAADGAMGEAQDDLQSDAKGQGGKGGRGHTGKGDAVEAQGRALQALREGAQGLQQQMQGQGQGQGRGGYAARGRRNMQGQGMGDSGLDPLGRPPDNTNGRTGGLLGDAVGGAERARRVLEEVRRRLADPARPPDERNYLERLMKRD